ncbi:uncharacterized protein BP01DRAFT_161378 [Aspergillus saccharolyticus JOP 1030-1]|uniref:Uncharacterized protein n=1 Tax=Aspergillus saccharolyticus JOP 1030-1 TaxID=1450539 RepID=A0A318Z398_9EURO|nr:hypothetical protein BP01DRAFT_161378 [Aspergillus saccharolyticus JOP 1030-1]PYH41745.1 hypothetical protein BP01DRAFT_161378 [Aspergillus saccharolyticus JOP 1030-1]
MGYGWLPRVTRMNCIRYMCPVFIFHVLLSVRVNCTARIWTVTDGISSTSFGAQKGKWNTQKQSPSMGLGTLDIQKWSAGIVSYTSWPLLLAFLFVLVLFLFLCSVAGNASLNIISHRHDHHHHHHHQLPLSIYQHSRVPGEWVYCFCYLLIIICIPHLFHVCVFCASSIRIVSLPCFSSPCVHNFYGSEDAKWGGV